MTGCTVTGCERAAVSKGLCLMHYKRVRNHGDPNQTHPRKPLVDRFMEKVSKDAATGCWNWIGAKRRKGYGAVNEGGGRGKGRQAHRVAYELFVGPIPEGEGFHGTCVCHRCDNPACVNPEHLFLGTVADNNRDMWGKGRGKSSPPRHRLPEWSRRGEEHHNAKVTAAQVAEIRSSNDSLRALAERFGVSKSAVHAIRIGKNWSAQ